MEQQVKTPFLIKIYSIVLVAELLGEMLWTTQDNVLLVYLFKPLLIPLLILWYIKESPQKSKILITALVFSFLGDVFLMFLPLNQNFFLAGLASFLTTHLLYVYVFAKSITQKQKSILWRRPQFVLLFLAYGLSLLLYLSKENLPEFHEMKVPIIVYASVIMLMVLVAIARYEKVNQKSFSLVLIGAVFFMFSDTLIALNNFSHFFTDIKYIAKLGIMILYGVGQYFIVKGILCFEQE